MSFSANVKDEIMKKNVFKKETKSFLQGVFMSAGSFVINGKNLYFVISNENENVIHFVMDKILEVAKAENLGFSSDDFLLVKVLKSFKQNAKFELSIDGAQTNYKFLNYLGAVREEKVAGSSEILTYFCLDKSYLKSQDTIIAFLTGLFLGSGTITIASEGKSGNHFEIVLNKKEQADIVSEAFSLFSIFPKQVERNGQYVVYLKNLDTICDVLNNFGAVKTTLDLFSKRIIRDENNNANRRSNCDAANLDKTMTASANQVSAIERIRDTIGLDRLPDTLKEAALLRLKYNQASLNDLLELMGNKISKGALSQRFKKIIDLSNELGDNDGK